MMRITFLLALRAAHARSVLVTACAPTRTTSAGRVGVDREQMMLVSSAEVDRSAAKAYQEAMQAAQSKKLLNRDAQQSNGCGRSPSA
jgi:3-dehydroquinate synthase class II